METTFNVYFYNAYAAKTETEKTYDNIDDAISYIMNVVSIFDLKRHDDFLISMERYTENSNDIIFSASNYTRELLY